MRKIIGLTKALCFILALFFALTAFGGFCHAQPPEDEQAENTHVPLGDEELSYFYKLGAPVYFKGVFGAHDFYFTKDANWVVNAATLYINFSQSDLLYEGTRSTLTVSINGEPIKSYNLLDYLGREAAITLPLPLGKIKKGINSIKIQAYRRVSDQPCADDVTHANWINVFDSSGVLITYNDKKPALSISEFPYPFYKIQESSSMPTAITLAEGAGEAEIAAALEMASYMGMFAGTRDMMFDTDYLSRLNGRGAKNIIHIAKNTSLPPELSGLIPADTPLGSGAFIKVAPSPYGSGRYILLVTAENDEDLERAVKFLGNSELTAQVSGGEYFLSRDVDVLTKDKPPSPTIKFSDLGYYGMYVYGMFEQNAELAVLLPKNRVVNDSASITIKYRYSDNLDFDNSLVSVFINGIPSGSKRLSGENANNDSLTLNIPPEARRGNYLHLRISFYLHLKDTWCRRIENEIPWAYVVEDSAIYLPTTQALNNYFENFPNPFVLDNKWSSTMFVLPDEPGPVDLQDAGFTAAMMGREIKSNHGTLKISKGQSREKDFATHSLIVIGSPAEQGIIKQINDSLFFRYEPQWQYFISNEKIELLPDYSRQLVSFQLLDSPFNNKTALLLLTSPNRERLSVVIGRHLQPSVFGVFLGDGALINTADEVANYRFKKEVVARPDFWTRDDWRNAKLFAIVSIFAAFLIIITLLLFRRKNRRMQIEEENGEKNE